MEHIISMYIIIEVLLSRPDKDGWRWMN